MICGARRSVREWTALAALTAFLMLGIMAMWPGQRPVVHLLRVATAISPDSTTGLGKVNINAAGEEELTVLPGIGPRRAAAIVSYRREHGAFGSVDDLSNVRGIGPTIVERLRDYATTGSDEAQ